MIHEVNRKKLTTTEDLFLIEKSNDLLAKWLKNQKIITAFRVVDTVNTNSHRMMRCCKKRKLVCAVYQKKRERKQYLINGYDDKFSLGQMKFCCLAKLKKEIKRVDKLSQYEHQYKASIRAVSSNYQRIRGSVGHVIFLAFFGLNERIHIAKSKVAKLLKWIIHATAPCNIWEWTTAVKDFYLSPSREKIKRIIFLYSPMYRSCPYIIEKMASEIENYLNNLPLRWKNAKAEIFETELGHMDLMIDRIIIDLKFTEKKIGWRRKNFEQLYRYWKLLKNKIQKEKIKGFAIFSPITLEYRYLTITQAEKKWSLDKTFQEDFKSWRLNTATSFVNVVNNINMGKVVGPNVSRIKVATKKIARNFSLERYFRSNVQRNGSWKKMNLEK